MGRSMADRRARSACRPPTRAATTRRARPNLGGACACAQTIGRPAHLATRDSNCRACLRRGVLRIERARDPARSRVLLFPQNRLGSAGGATSRGKTSSLVTSLVSPSVKNRAYGTPRDGEGRVDPRGSRKIHVGAVDLGGSANGNARLSRRGIRGAFERRGGLDDDLQARGIHLLARQSRSGVNGRLRVEVHDRLFDLAVVACIVDIQAATHEPIPFSIQEQAGAPSNQRDAPKGIAVEPQHPAIDRRVRHKVAQQGGGDEDR
jgi:hypothetical protein